MPGVFDFVYERLDKKDTKQNYKKLTGKLQEVCNTNNGDLALNEKRLA